MNESEELVIISMQPGTDIKANFDEIEKYIERLLEDYQGIMEGSEYGRKDLADAKKDRANLNGLVKALDQRRLEAKRLYMAPIDAFELRIKTLLTPVKEVIVVVDAQIKALEAEEAATKRAKIKAHYEEYAGILLDAVPFERIEDPRWLNKTENLMNVFKAVEERVEKIALDEAMLTELNLPHAVEARAEFFATLDVGKAIARAKQIEEQLAKAAQFEAEKAAIIREREAWKAVEAAPATAPEAPPEEPQAHLTAPATPMAVVAEENSIWTLQVECTRAELDSIIAYIKSIGVQGRAVR